MFRVSYRGRCGLSHCVFCYCVDVDLLIPRKKNPQEHLVELFKKSLRHVAEIFDFLKEMLRTFL